MKNCIDRGLKVDGGMPGGLKVKRRAKSIHDKLNEERRNNRLNPLLANDWLSVYAMAVNEENAGGGRIVTAPTYGAAGVIPATIRYYLHFPEDATPADIRTFLLTAAAIGVNMPAR
ncbi:Serine dehydratase alpha chain [Ensifer sp. YR511]|nr:Serine dehydratase alpha chain [Ensifer sp. YR511]